MQIKAENLRKEYNGRLIFKNINLEIGDRACVAITGINGSGKTTLIRILANLVSPTMGKVIYQSDGAEISKEKIHRYCSLVGPYLELYQDLTARENLWFFGKLKKVDQLDSKIERLMNKFGLKGREDEAMKNYSSGMKQRLKYVFALISEPEILFVDEPGSNLDDNGIQTVYEVLEEQKKNKILIMATNEKEDLKYADRIVRIDG